MVYINKWLDFLDRVAWTFLATVSGTLSADSIFNAELDWKMKLGAPLLAAVFTSVKVVIAQRQGQTPLGSLVPGEVIEPQERVADN